MSEKIPNPTELTVEARGARIKGAGRIVERVIEELKKEFRSFPDSPPTAWIEVENEQYCDVMLAKQHLEEAGWVVEYDKEASGHYLKVRSKSKIEEQGGSDEKN